MSSIESRETAAQPQPSSKISCGPAERNKVHIVHHLRKYVEECQQVRESGTSPQTVPVLEVASGTGEHAAYFTQEISGMLLVT
jgi:hypothetical protein